MPPVPLSPPFLTARIARRCTCLPPPGTLPPCRYFTASRPLFAASPAQQNHYERLGVRHDASAGDIKRTFYRLSKAHHPDANPNDPSAASRFSLLSESYTVLSNPSRRQTYDRDVLRLHTQQHSSSSQHHHPRGSYSSTQAGGRSPSGLSRRRTTFRGPPPSFYRSGGWGNHADKRRKAHDESTGNSGVDSSSSDAHHNSSDPPPPPYQDGASYGHGRRHAGMGPGADPFGHGDDVPHFDQEGHTRTHKRQDRRRRERRAMGDDDIEFEPQTSLVGHFVIVTGILAAAFVAPFVYMRVTGSARRKERSS